MCVANHPLQLVRSLILASMVVLLPLSAHAVTVPLWSEVEYLLIADDVNATNKQRQEATVDRISEAFRIEREGLVRDVAVDASWTDLDSGIVSFDHLRGDDNPNGFRRNFHGETGFRFAFSVAAAEQLTIDYGALGTTASMSTNGLIKWWAMHGFDIIVARECAGPVSTPLSFVNEFAPANAPSPQRFDGTLLAPLTPGTPMLEIRLTEDASGNLLGDRSMSGGFTFAIAEASLVPLPAALWLLCAAAPLVCRTRRHPARRA